MAALGRQKFIRATYAQAAAALAATGKEEDLALAQDVTSFVAAMPPAVSRRLARAREIMMAQRAAGQGERTPEMGSKAADKPDREPHKPRDRER